MKTLTGIFPEPIYIFNLNRSFSKKEKQVIRKEQKKVNSNIFNRISKNKNILSIGDLSDIKSFIALSFKEYLEDVVAPKNRVGLYTTESWLNFTRINERHHKHYHSNSFISGVFYFNTAKKDMICFHKKPSNNLEIETDKFNFFNCNSWDLPVTPGQLVLFPSYLEHSVPVVEEKVTRISLSFNTFILGDISNVNAISLKI
tara:strand:- start:273 stop:875 length:603 start_codon:yes stop_codon:yes gene_type:complete